MKDEKPTSDNQGVDSQLSLFDGVKEPVNDDEITHKREKVLSSIHSSKFDTLQEKVAWLLNTFPETRNSDITLQLKYWEMFENDIYNGFSISPEDLYKLTKLNSITRARATIQNTYRLFQASHEIRKRRGKLEESEKEKAKIHEPDIPLYTVFMDESGKKARHHIIGSLWVLESSQTLFLPVKIKKTLNNLGFDQELHFQKITAKNLSTYKLIVDQVFENASFLSFKFISVESEGVGRSQEVYTKLFYHLLVEGIKHENDSGRAPLPRSVQVWKDAEQKGYDKMLLAELADRLRQAAKNRFHSKLYIDEFYAVNSKTSPLIQIADLFTGCVNRLLNSDSGNQHAKDGFTAYFLGKLNIHKNELAMSATGDLFAYLKL